MVGTCARFSICNTISLNISRSDNWKNTETRLLNLSPARQKVGNLATKYGTLKSKSPDKPTQIFVRTFFKDLLDNSLTYFKQFVFVVDDESSIPHIIAPWSSRVPRCQDEKQTVSALGLMTWQTNIKGLSSPSAISWYWNQDSIRISISLVWSASRKRMDPSAYTYPSPLAGYGGLTPLSDEKAEDGKSESLKTITVHCSVSYFVHLCNSILILFLKIRRRNWPCPLPGYVNIQTGILSKSYEKFQEPLDNGRRGGL